MPKAKHHWRHLIQYNTMHILKLALCKLFVCIFGNLKQLTICSHSTSLRNFNSVLLFQFYSNVITPYTNLFPLSWDTFPRCPQWRCLPYFHLTRACITKDLTSISLVIVLKTKHWLHRRVVKTFCKINVSQVLNKFSSPFVTLFSVS